MNEPEFLMFLMMLFFIVCGMFMLSIMYYPKFKRTFINPIKEFFNDIKNKEYLTVTNQLINRRIERYHSFKENYTYYQIYINGHNTDIKWRNYKDAKFFYNHIVNVKKESINYTYTDGNNNIVNIPLYYYICAFDKITFYIFDIWTSPKEIFLNSYINKQYLSDYDINYYYFKFNLANNRSLKKAYIDLLTVLDSNKFSNTTILDSTKQKNNNVNISNKDLEELRKLIKEYSDSVELSRKVAEILTHNIKK